MTTESKAAPPAKQKEKAKLPAVPGTMEVARHIFEGKGMETELLKVLPASIRPEALVRTMLSAMQKQPRLFECTSLSLCGSLIAVGQLGLSLDPNLGHAYLVPFRDNRRGVVEAQLQVGYKGMVLMGKEASDVIFTTEVVYDGEDFKYERGSDEYVKHTPPLDREDDPRKMIGAYAIATFADNRKKSEVMGRREIERIRNAAPSARGKSSPWDTHYAEMAKKTALRRLFKTIPNARLQLAASIDELAAEGIRQNLSARAPRNLDGVEFEVVTPDGDDGDNETRPSDIDDPKAKRGKKKSRRKRKQPDEPAQTEPSDTETAPKRWSVLCEVGVMKGRPEETQWTEQDITEYLEDCEIADLEVLSEADFEGVRTYLMEHYPNGDPV